MRHDLYFFKTVLFALVAFIGVGQALADVKVRLRDTNDFVVEQRGGDVKLTVTREGGLVPLVVVDEAALDALDGQATVGETVYYRPDACLRSWDGAAWSSCREPAYVCAGGVHTTTETAVVEMPGPNGRTWMDRNLGAARRATSLTDEQAYGSLFQWGRGADGHECRGSATYPDPGPVTGLTGAWDGKFVANSISPYNWTSVSPAGGALWGDGSGSRGDTTKGATDPCPTGYRVPNYNELYQLNLANDDDAFTTLALSLAGIHSSNGTVYDEGSYGFYWSSTVSGIGASALYFSNTSAYMVTSSKRAAGMSVRCIKQ